MFFTPHLAAGCDAGRMAPEAAHLGRNQSRMIGRGNPAGGQGALYFCFLVALTVWPVGMSAADLRPLPGVVLRDFVWPEYHDPPHERQLRFRLQAAQAEPGDGAWVRVREVVLERFDLEGQREWWIGCDHGEFHTGTQEARSDGSLEVRLRVDRLRLQGQGFLWRQTNMWLVVSNKVQAVLRGRWIEAPGAESGSSTNRLGIDSDEMRIESVQFTYNGMAGRAEFAGNVRAVRSNLMLRCERLQFRLPHRGMRVDQVVAEGQVIVDWGDLHAEADRGLFDPVRGQLALVGQVRWRRAEASGAADSLDLDLTGERLFARGNASLEWVRTGRNFLPRPGPNADALLGHFRIVIRSAEYQITSTQAEFEGDVEAVETPVSGPAGRLTCRTLRVHTASGGELESVVASRDVIFEHDQLQVTGREAVYRARLNRLEVIGPTHWKDGPRFGSGNRAWFDLAQHQVGVEGDAELVWPRPPTDALLALAGPPPGGRTPGSEDGTTDETTFWTRIRCGAYVWSRVQMDFTGGVQVEDTTMELNCAQLTIHPPLESQGDPDLTATGDVVIHVRFPGQPEVTATCQEARYEADTAVLRLTGQPVIEREDGSRFTAEAVEYHRRTGVITTVGSVRARVERGALPLTNALPGLPGPR